MFHLQQKEKSLLTEASAILTPLMCASYSTRKMAFQTSFVEIMLAHAHLRFNMSTEKRPSFSRTMCQQTLHIPHSA